MDAIVTAGGRISGEFAAKAGVTVKALIDIGGKPVVCRVVDAVRELPEVERVFIIGPEELKDSPLADRNVEFLPEMPDGSLNFMLGLEHCSSENGSKALFAASDLPFITADAIRSFLDTCGPDAHFCYPVVLKERFIRDYPGVPVKFESLKDGKLTGGCVFLLDPGMLLSNREMIERIFNARKSPVKMASILGWKFIWSALTRSLTVDTCVKRASDVFGCNCRAVIDSPPELAYDMDDLDDYEYAIRTLGRVNA